MNASPPSSRAQEKSPLVQEVERILGNVLGVQARFSPAPKAWGPLAGAMGVLAIYALAWWAVDAIAASAGAPRHVKFVSLLAWGGCYFAATYFLAKTATAHIIETIERDIEQHAPPEYLERVTQALSDRYRPGITVALPIAIAAVSLVAATFAVAADIEGGWPSRRLLTSPEFLFWAATYFIYFLTAAQAVIAAQFYLAFADHLEMATDSFYLLKAADSPLVVGLARLGSRVLIFWLMIFLAILSSMLLAIPWLDDYAFPPRSLFLLLLVPVAGFFSLGVGSLVYVGSEAKIRAVLRRFTQKEMAPLREQTNRLFSGGAPEPANREELEKLADLHDRVVAGGKYGSRMAATLSLALPLALPVVSIFKLLIDF